VAWKAAFGRRRAAAFSSDKNRTTVRTATLAVRTGRPQTGHEVARGKRRASPTPRSTHKRRPHRTRRTSFKRTLVASVSLRPSPRPGRPQTETPEVGHAERGSFPPLTLFRRQDRGERRSEIVTTGAGTCAEVTRACPRFFAGAGSKTPRWDTARRPGVPARPARVVPAGRRSRTYKTAADTVVRPPANTALTEAEKKKTFSVTFT